MASIEGGAVSIDVTVRYVLFMSSMGIVLGSDQSPISTQRHVLLVLGIVCRRKDREIGLVGVCDGAIGVGWVGLSTVGGS